MVMETREVETPRAFPVNWDLQLGQSIDCHSYKQGKVEHNPHFTNLGRMSDRKQDLREGSHPMGARLLASAV